jgi:hypothetical protein
MLRFVACDRGRLGGGVGDPEGAGEGKSVKRGAGGRTPFVNSSSPGGKADRGRGTIRLGGDAERSMAEAARAGGGTGDTPFGFLRVEWLGDVV